MCHQYHAGRVLMLRPWMGWEEGIFWLSCAQAEGPSFPCCRFPPSHSSGIASFLYSPSPTCSPRPSSLPTSTRLLFQDTWPATRLFFLQHQHTSILLSTTTAVHLPSLWSCSGRRRLVVFVGIATSSPPHHPFGIRTAAQYKTLTALQQYKQYTHTVSHIQPPAFPSSDH